jgi:non-homologous end joining protein Ku
MIADPTIFGDLAYVFVATVLGAIVARLARQPLILGYNKSQFVLITDEDLAKAPVEATQAIDVRDFVPADEIPWTFFENAYYVEPANQGFRAYALLREALKESGRVGIAPSSFDSASI